MPDIVLNSAALAPEILKVFSALLFCASYNTFPHVSFHFLIFARYNRFPPCTKFAGNSRPLVKGGAAAKSIIAKYVTASDIIAKSIRKNAVQISYEHYSENSK